VSFSSANEAFKAGGVIAYPTEAVFGLGCDPDNESAVNRLLSIKKRSPNKGLILLASDYSQIIPYIDDQLIPTKRRNEMLATWPNGTSFVLPAASSIPKYLIGQFSTIAVRVTDQPDVKALCSKIAKPVVSTSANISGEEAAKDWQSLSTEIKNQVDYIVKGKTLGYNKPSQIIDVMTGTVYRS